METQLITVSGDPNSDLYWKNFQNIVNFETTADEIFIPTHKCTSQLFIDQDVTEKQYKTIISNRGKLKRGELFTFSDVRLTGEQLTTAVVGNRYVIENLSSYYYPSNTIPERDGSKHINVLRAKNLEGSTSAFAKDTLRVLASSPDQFFFSCDPFEKEMRPFVFGAIARYWTFLTLTNRNHNPILIFTYQPSETQIQIMDILGIDAAFAVLDVKRSYQFDFLTFSVNPAPIEASNQYFTWLRSRLRYEVPSSHHPTHVYIAPEVSNLINPVPEMIDIQLILEESGYTRINLNEVPSDKIVNLISNADSIIFADNKVSALLFAVKEAAHVVELFHTQQPQAEESNGEQNITLAANLGLRYTSFGTTQGQILVNLSRHLAVSHFSGLVKVPNIRPIIRFIDGSSV